MANNIKRKLKCPKNIKFLNLGLVELFSSMLSTWKAQRLKFDNLEVHGLKLGGFATPVVACDWNPHGFWTQLLPFFMFFCLSLKWSSKSILFFALHLPLLVWNPYILCISSSNDHNSLISTLVDVKFQNDS